MLIIIIIILVRKVIKMKRLVYTVFEVMYVCMYVCTIVLKLFFTNILKIT